MMFPGLHSEEKFTSFKILWHVFGTQSRTIPAWDSGPPRGELSPRLPARGWGLPRLEPHPCLQDLLRGGRRWKTGSEGARLLGTRVL